MNYSTNTQNSEDKIQTVNFAIKEGRFEDAIRIGSREVFADNKTIQMQVENARQLKSKSSLSFEDSLDKEQFLSMLKTKLYYDKITLEDIKSIEDYPLLSEYQKQLILLAIYEKQKDIKKLSQIVRSYKEKYPDSEQNKIFNTIFERAKNKKHRIFDFLFYDNLLNWKMDSELQEQYENEKPNTTPKIQLKRIPIIQTTSPYYEEAEEYNYFSNNYITSENVKTSFVDTLKTPKEKISRTDTAKTPKKVKVQKSTTHYDEILKYLNEKRKEIYVSLNSADISTQKMAISQWDKMEILLEKVMQNKNNLEYLNSLYSKITKLQEYENSKAR